MELTLKNGVYPPNPTGGVATVTGTEELAQRLAMKLGARRGAFAPMPEFGSRMGELLRTVKPSQRAAAAALYAAEALSGEPQVSVEGAEVTPLPDGGARVTLTLAYGGEASAVELTI
jgi:phage baseplate assembly protein W